MTVRLLIADDTLHVRKMLVDILDLHGFEIVGEAADGDEAVVRTAETDPDVVVMDLKMPRTDGLEAARRIREGRDDQKVILYSAYLDDDVRRQAQAIGVDTCVSKGQGIEALAREISALVMDIGR
ncbi:MAG TPA: response regulator transcription factor [Actinomycetota bacterium]|nr:response regulator transcription factor [Actinomycetota bacterium]